MPGGNVGFNAAVAELFRGIPAFTANVDSMMTNRADKTRVTVPMKMLKSRERFRIEVDLVKMKGNSFALQGLAGMQNIGMSRMHSLVLPNEKGMLILFPDLNSYTRVPLSEMDIPSGGFKMSRKAAGKETIQGKSCAKFEVVLTAPDGAKTAATVWESEDLGNFPVRMLFRPDDATMLMEFSQISLAPPEEALFEIPKDYKGFNGISGLMQEAMKQAFRPAESK